MQEPKTIDSSEKSGLLLVVREQRIQARSKLSAAGFWPFDDGGWDWDGGLDADYWDGDWFDGWDGDL